MLHWRYDFEFSIKDIPDNLALFAFIGVVSLAPDLTAKAFPAHDPKYCLFTDSKTPFGLEHHCDLTISHAIRCPREYLVYKRVHVLPYIGLGIFAASIAAIGILGNLELVEHKLKWVSVSQRIRYLCSILSVKTSIRFKIWFSNSSLRIRASSSSSRKTKVFSSFLRLLLGLRKE